MTSLKVATQALGEHQDTLVLLLRCGLTLKKFFKDAAAPLCDPPQARATQVSQNELVSIVAGLSVQLGETRVVRIQV